jgi:peptide/nickel transport system substrate-binding protein
MFVRHNRLLLALVPALSLFGCKPSPPSTSDGTGARIVERSHGPDDRSTSEERNEEFERRWNDFYDSEYEIGGTLVVGEIGDADSLNDLTHGSRNADNIIQLLFLQLTHENPDFSHAPELAKSWEFSEDHLELTFHLRDDVHWTDAEKTKTTAHDVKFTFEKQRNPNIAWSAIKWKQFITDCEVIDDYTVKFVFERVYPYQLMDAAVGVILPKHLLEHLADEEWKDCEFNRKPVGNGPFTLDEWKAQQHIKIVANEDFYRGRPPLDRIIFKVIPDQENLVLQLKSGEIDFMERVPPRFFDDLSKQEHLAADVYPGRNYAYIGWNMREPLFESKKVRQALTMAVNRQEIVDALLFEFGEICQGPISPILWAHNPDLPDFPFDPEKAKQLLAEEGWTDSDGDGWLDKDGQRFSFALKTNKGNQTREDVTVMVQDMFQDIGVEVKPNILEWTVLLNDMNQRNFQSVVMGWSVATKMDMTTVWHSDSISDKFNFVSYSNAEFDQLNDTAIFEMDPEKARAMWWRAQEMIVEDQPYTFLYTPKDINFIHKRFENVQMETLGWIYNLQQWWVPKDKRKYEDAGEG